MPRTYVTSSRVETRREGYLAAGRLAPEGGPSRMTGRLGGTRARACVLAAALVARCARGGACDKLSAAPAAPRSWAGADARAELRRERPPAPVRVRGQRQVRAPAVQVRGLEGTRLRALPGRLPADALRLRADPREAGPERRANR